MAGSSRATRWIVTLGLAAIAVVLFKSSNGFVSRATEGLVGDRGLPWSVYSTWYTAVWIALALSIMGLLGVAAAFLWGCMVGPPKGLQLLSLGPTGLDAKHMALLILSAGFPTYVSANLREWFFGPASEHLRSFDARLLEAQGAALIALLAAISLAPAIFEELLFRGYLFGALRRCVPMPMAIGVVTLLFAGMHMDPQHIFGVLLPGLWMTLVAWRSGSTRTSMLVHFVGNLIGASLGAAGIANADHIPSWLHVVALLIALPCFAALLPWMFSSRARP